MTDDVVTERTVSSIYEMLVKYTECHTVSVFKSEYSVVTAGQKRIKTRKRLALIASRKLFKSLSALTHGDARCACASHLPVTITAFAGASSHPLGPI